MEAFAYSQNPHSRRHGPKGYSRYESYRPWLRDEFGFRCVYCLTRERWGKGPYEFHVDHLIPQRKAPERAVDYDNLVYACSRCNGYKRDIEDIPDPCRVPYGKCLRVGRDGKIEALTDLGTFLVRVLRLDNAENTQHRQLILEILQLAQSRRKELYVKLMGFPSDLPELASRRPPDGNSRAGGIEQSFFARRSRGELGKTY